MVTLGEPESEESATEGHARGQIVGMSGEAGAAHRNRFLVTAGTEEFFGELGENDRRRVPADPAPEVFDSSFVRHAARYYLMSYGATVTFLVIVAVLPAASVTVRRTTQVPASVKTWLGF